MGVGIESRPSALRSGQPGIAAKGVGRGRGDPGLARLIHVVHRRRLGDGGQGGLHHRGGERGGEGEGAPQQLVGIVLLPNGRGVEMRPRPVPPPTCPALAFRLSTNRLSPEADTTELAMPPRIEDESLAMAPLKLPTTAGTVNNDRGQCGWGQKRSKPPPQFGHLQNKQVNLMRNFDSLALSFPEYHSIPAGIAIPTGFSIGTGSDGPLTSAKAFFSIGFGSRYKARALGGKKLFLDSVISGGSVGSAREFKRN